jgi:hypothetical protein
MVGVFIIYRRSDGFVSLSENKLPPNTLNHSFDEVAQVTG